MYHSKKLDKNFVVMQEQIKCDSCLREMQLGDNIIVQRCYTKKKFGQFYWCNKCISKIRKRGEADSFLTTQITNRVLDGSTLFPTAISIRGSRGTDVWRFAISDKGINADSSNIKVIDRTRLVGRDSRPIDIDEVKKITEDRVKELDKPVKKSDINPLFDDVFSAKPVEKEKVKPLIENEKLDEIEHK